ncbi:hypothetical protein C0995_001353 [Termitomyces sp. Mi166|nr:hypothetical protein C0995_001353 [Termitomyces sp. Mi166\
MASETGQTKHYQYDDFDTFTRDTIPQPSKLNITPLSHTSYATCNDNGLLLSHQYIPIELSHLVAPLSDTLLMEPVTPNVPDSGLFSFDLTDEVYDKSTISIAAVTAWIATSGVNSALSPNITVCPFIA